MAAENALLKQQLLIYNRSLKRAPKLKPIDRFILGLGTMLTSPSRIVRAAIIIKPSTLMKFHKALIKNKYKDLYSPKTRMKPGPKGPSQDIINVILEMKKRNPGYGYSRIALQINIAFGLDIKKDVVRRILDQHYKPVSGGDGPSWLSFMAHTKDSLWNIDLFRCESVLLKSYWVLLVMDLYTRRIVGFSVNRGDVDGATLCCMFNKITSKETYPGIISSDNDPLFLFHRWQANLRIMEIEEVKTIPYTPISHPFIERLIGTIRREFLDKTLFWTTLDLEKKLELFQNYYNKHRAHMSRDGKTPVQSATAIVDLSNFRWKNYCRGLYNLPCPA